MLLSDAQNFDRTKCGEDSQIRKYFELGNVGRIYKSLGCLKKKQKKKKGYFVKRKKKKNACKLLKKLYYKSGLIYGTIYWNWINWEANL